ncbi:MAG TPA: secretion system protein E, partial [Opitutae bacterium]|nr:secretion system protein E [Opitutae bacterium]
MDWWPGLADLDRITILSAPIEDRARLLASKYSHSLDETMREIGKKSQIAYVEDFELPENPTTLLPLRLIHNYSCLPVGLDEEDYLQLVTVWPPSDRMSRWVFAVSGKKPVWSLSSPEKISRAITENFGIGADSLDDSDLDL